MPRGVALQSVVLSAFAFWALSLAQLQLPGLYYDEALDAVPAMQLVMGQRVELVRDAGLTVAGIRLPLMAMDYVGPVYTYLYVPLFAVAGTSTFTARWLPISLGAVTIALTFAWTRRAFGDSVAAAAALLLATHPSYVFWSRQGVSVTAVLAFFAVGALWLSGSWLRRPRRATALALGLALGLGLTAKVLFLWFIVALLAVGVAVVAFRARERRPEGFSTARASILSGALGFLAGALPLIVYNLMSQGTLRAIAANLETTAYGVSNADYLANLVGRARAFLTLMQGSGFWYLGGIERQVMFPWAIGIALVVVMAFVWFGRRLGNERREAAALLGIVGLFFLQSGFTISGLWPTHFFLLLPLLAVVAALGLKIALHRTVFLLACVSLLVLGNVWTDLRYHVDLAETGGRRAHSDAIARLADILQEREGPVYALDWGMKTNLQVITAGRVDPVEVFQYQTEPDAVFRDYMWGALHDSGARLVFKTPEATVFPRFEHVERLAREWRFKLVLEAEALERDGTPLYLVYAVERLL